MQINSGITAAILQGLLSRRTPAAAEVSAGPHVTPTASAEKITISQAARDRIAAESAPRTTAEFDTDKGRLNLDIDAYFAPPGVGGVDLDKVPLLMPSEQNIEALRSHISAAMPAFLARNGIPAAPASIGYDRMGQPQLPADYAYAEEFKQALAKEPTLARKLSTVNALTSHMVEMKKSLSFMAEYAAANSQAEVAAVVAKYHYLFADNRPTDEIALHFSAGGELSLTANGKPIA